MSNTEGTICIAVILAALVLGSVIAAAIDSHEEKTARANGCICDPAGPVTVLRFLRPDCPYHSNRSKRYGK
jgi:hypothetical protein